MQSTVGHVQGLHNQYTLLQSTVGHVQGLHNWYTLLQSTVGHVQGLRRMYVRHVQCHVLQHWRMAVNVCPVLETSASTQSNGQGTNIVVVKGTTHTGMKDMRTKAMVITFASFGVGQFKKI